MWPFYLAVIYTIDSHCQRSLGAGRKQTQATLCCGLAALGEEAVGGLRFVRSNGWQSYLEVVVISSARKP